MNEVNERRENREESEVKKEGAEKELRREDMELIKEKFELPLRLS